MFDDMCSRLSGDGSKKFICFSKCCASHYMFEDMCSRQAGDGSKKFICFSNAVLNIARSIFRLLGLRFHDEFSFIALNPVSSRHTALEIYQATVQWTQFQDNLINAEEEKHQRAFSQPDSY